MPAEIKILLYAFFSITLFFIDNLMTFVVIFIVMTLLLFKIPFMYLKKGWIPISLFLLFTFLSNIVFQKGRILYKAGPVIVTDEGVHMASVRVARIFLMIGGAKILSATTQTETIVNALGNIFKPLERFGIPVMKFFWTMGLAIKYIPIIRGQISELYRERIRNEHMKGLTGRAKIISNILLPFFIASINNPDKFHNYRKTDGKEN